MEGDLDRDALRTAVAPFALGLLVLFGSRARASHRADSDVDLGALHRTGRRLDHRELGALHLALSRACGLSADVVDLATSDAVFRHEIAAQGRPLFESEPGAWVGFVARALIDHDDVAPFVKACVAAVGRAAREAPGG